jgi:lipoprotein NlpI
MPEKSASGRRTLVLVLAAVLAVLFVTSFWYRMEHPSLRVEMRTERQAPPGMGQGMDMNRVQELMARMGEKPEDVPTLLELADLFMGMEAWDRAALFLERAGKIAPEDPRVLRGLGMVHFEKKEFDKAAAAFAKILEREPQDPTTHYNLGIVLKHYLNRKAEADAHFKAVMGNAAADQELRQEAARELGEK